MHTRAHMQEIPVGAVANKKISYTNPYPAFRTFSMRSNQPWLLQVSRGRQAAPLLCTCKGHSRLQLWLLRVRGVHLQSLCTCTLESKAC